MLQLNNLDTMLAGRTKTPENLTGSNHPNMDTLSMNPWVSVPVSSPSTTLWECCHGKLVQLWPAEM